MPGTRKKEKHQVLNDQIWLFSGIVCLTNYSTIRDLSNNGIEWSFVRKYHMIDKGRGLTGSHLGSTTLVDDPMIRTQMLSI